MWGLTLNRNIILIWEVKRPILILTLWDLPSDPVPNKLLESALTPKVGMCQMESITYTIICVGCASVGVSTMYWGESGRSGYQRSLEHLRAHQGKNKNSPLWKHSFGHHNGVKQCYSFTVLKSHKSALDRQITEAVLIQVAGPDMLLNSHGEWNICKIPRLILEDDEPMEDWVSQRSKRKNISSDQDPSSGSLSSGGDRGKGGDGSKEYDGESELSSMSMDVSNCNESKTKKSRQAELTHPTTSGLSTAAELDITRSDFKEYGAEYITEDGVRKSIINVEEKESREVKSLKEGKV